MLQTQAVETQLKSLGMSQQKWKYFNLKGERMTCMCPAANDASYNLIVFAHISYYG